MVKRSSLYRRLPSKRSWLMMKKSLWQGPDHLLWAKTAFTSVNYKRFYYKDIQALILCRNGRQHFWTVLWGLLTLLFLVISLMNASVFYLSIAMTGVWSICLLLNLFMGPCCEVYIQTAVQFERLSHLVRVSKAVITLDGIKALVERDQGPFSYSQDTAADGYREIRATVVSDNDIKRQNRGAPLDTTGSSFSPYLHYGLFIALLVIGVNGMAQWQLKHALLAAVDLIALAVILVLVITAMARWHRHIKGTLLAMLSWLTMIWGGLHLVASYILFIASNVRHAGMSHNQTEIYRIFLQMHSVDHIAITTATIGFSVSALVLATFGFVSTLEQQRRLTVLDVNSAVSYRR